MDNNDQGHQDPDYASCSCDIAGLGQGLASGHGNVLENGHGFTRLTGDWSNVGCGTALGYGSVTNIGNIGRGDNEGAGSNAGYDDGTGGE